MSFKGATWAVQTFTCHVVMAIFMSMPLHPTPPQELRKACGPPTHTSGQSSPPPAGPRTLEPVHTHWSSLLHGEVVSQSKLKPLPIALLDSLEFKDRCVCQEAI